MNLRLFFGSCMPIRMRHCIITGAMKELSNGLHWLILQLYDEKLIRCNCVEIPDHSVVMSLDPDPHFLIGGSFPFWKVRQIKVPHPVPHVTPFIDGSDVVGDVPLHQDELRMIQKKI